MESVAVYERIAALTPADSEAWREAGVGYAMLKRFDESLQCLDKALKVNPHDHLAWDFNAVTLARRGKYPLGLSVVDGGLMHCPGTAQLWRSAFNGAAEGSHPSEVPPESRGGRDGVGGTGWAGRMVCINWSRMNRQNRQTNAGRRTHPVNGVEPGVRIRAQGFVQRLASRSCGETGSRPKTPSQVNYLECRMVLCYKSNPFADLPGKAPAVNHGHMPTRKLNDEQVTVNGQYNIGHICTRQQCELGLGDKVAFRWISAHQERTDYTFNDLDSESSRFANALQSLGFAAGDILFTFLPKTPEQFFSFLGALKLQVICGTLFSNFGDEALLDRLGDAKAKGIVTKTSLLKKILRVRDRLPALQFIIVSDLEEHRSSDILSYAKLMHGACADFISPETAPETPSVVHYTSGSTGKPKGVLHAHRSILHQSRTASEVLNLTPADIFWCTADQGWVTGTSYGIIGPWSLGVTQIHYGGGYDAELWFRLLQEESVTVWYSAPTALRMLMREDKQLYESCDLKALRHVFSVGEPLNPEVISWARSTLGKDIYDTWFQTETGGIMITNRPGIEIKPGSMGTPLAGIEPAIVADDGEMLGNNEQGNLCLKIGWPSMFTAYLNNDAVYSQKFRNGYYWTGDTAVRDNDGYYWFKGRSDDVINTAGHLISPFEVESALLEIEEVAESGVIGVPDDLLYEKIVAFVHLHKQCAWSRELEVKVRLHVSNKASSIATPHEIIIVDGVPKNKSGKIMRRVLKARYLGQDAGDISTLEE